MNIKQSYRKCLASGCVFLGLAGALDAQASVVVGGTRLIYNAKDAEVTIKLSNQGQSPALVQAWIDGGDIKAAPSDIDAPFTVTPPMSRIDPGKGQTLRVVYMGEPLPQQKESLFWLNVLEAPPKAAAEDANKLQLVLRTRIKVFYRPTDLKAAVEDAPAKIEWRLTQKDGHPALEARNPTPYHVSFTAISASAGGKTSTAVADMVNPQDSRVFPLKGDAPATADLKVHYTTLNDFGGAVEGSSVLQRNDVPARTPPND
ncbi:fimbria/pilus periplasmic chaperone [Burkholderia stabilis]|uniref:Chaperone protein fimC,putative chaperone protein EcpD,Gram-negative pili assembly chaperone, N-terminal domain n=1 Tax=Burkholderia stabilis TaxID=95485 RepID=A0AAJ5T7L0_9BURK|nr:fimbria/pilus periplasmic chaperone [Burkholderia stabilis]VBB15675.1 Chaperone protein fimC precursor,putative chaperone protein EcpD,Gram-negative pili assembly chaperone, N-terminal domain [Burkholderia stabilis]